MGTRSDWTYPRVGWCPSFPRSPRPWPPRCPTGWWGPPSGAPIRPGWTWSGCGDEEPRPPGGHRAGTRPGGGQPGGEPTGGRRAPAGGRRAGVGDGDRVGRPGPRVAAPAGARRAGGRGARVVAHGGGRVAPSGRPRSGAGGGADLAGPLDGGGLPDLQRRHGGAAGTDPRLRRPSGPVPRVGAGRPGGTRARPGPPARRALCLHRRGRARRLPRDPDRPGVGSGPHLVRTLDGHRPGHACRPGSVRRSPPG